VSLTVSSVSQLNQIIDEIRRLGGLIHAIVPERRSLEDRFIQAIQLDGKADFDQISLDRMQETDQ